MKIQNHRIQPNIPLQAFFMAPMQLRGVRDQLYSAVSAEKKSIFQRFINWLKSILDICYCRQKKQTVEPPVTVQPEVALQRERQVEDGQPLPIEINQLNLQLEEMRAENAQQNAPGEELVVADHEPEQIEEELQRRFPELPGRGVDLNAGADIPQRNERLMRPLRHGQYGGQIRRLSAGALAVAAPDLMVPGRRRFVEL